MNQTTSKIRYVLVKGEKYLRLEDVVDYMRAIADTEETDVRNRLYEAVQNLLQGNP